MKSRGITKSRTIGAALAACLTLLAAAPAAQAEFGLSAFEVSFTDEQGFEQRQAGSHPFAMTTFFRVNTFEEGGVDFTDGRVRDAFVEQLAGFVGDATSYPRCSAADFASLSPQCSRETIVGIQATGLSSSSYDIPSAVYNLEPPPGSAARLGFQAANQKVTIDVGVNPATNNVIAGSRGISQQALVFASVIQLWGDPSHPAHDSLRANCAQTADLDFASLEEVPEFVPNLSCSNGIAPRDAFLTLPTRCGGANRISYAADRWEDPARFLATGLPDLSDPAWATGGFSPPRFTGCAKLGFDPEIEAQPTSRAAQSPTGLDFELAVADEGLKSTEVGALGESHVRKAVVTLPEGMTANPSIAEGLEVCSEGDLARETAASDPGDGCPQASKIGTIEVESPLIDQSLTGSLYQAEPFDNLAGDSLIAFYMVMKNADLGILVKQPVRVDPDSDTGQLVATADEIPQLPFSSFRLRFREGGRSPLITPPTCGSHTVEAVLHPWSGGPPHRSDSTFRIISGPNNGPCPSGALPFEPGFAAGTLNNAAGSFSPFLMRLTRRDGDQDLTRFDAILPKGALAKLAGVARCPEPLIAQIDRKTGKEELASPSCPLASKIGNVQAGAGVGSQLTYVPGSVYLAGPFGGAPLSVVGVVPAVAGPFDVGVVKTRQALQIDPVTGVASVDGALSDPIPHILAGIPLNVRDIQVSINRPQFTLNPTSCDPMATVAGIWGGGEHVFSTADDFPVIRNARFQAASCQALGFKPRIRLQLFGGIKRGKYQGVRAVVRPRPGHANIAGSVVRFPRSAFIAQEHLKNICTRVQFAANACPKGSVYGNAVAWSPLLGFPLRGKVHLRSSNNTLPDLVADLRGPAHTPIKVEVSIRNDSAKGALRNTVQTVPDAPVSYFRLQTFGGDKGLIVNSRNICRGRNAARTVFHGQNGKRVVQSVPVRNARCKKRKAKRSARRARVSRANALG